MTGRGLFVRGHQLQVGDCLASVGDPFVITRFEPYEDYSYQADFGPARIAFDAAGIARTVFDNYLVPVTGGPTHEARAGAA